MNKAYLITDDATGEISETGSCQFIDGEFLKKVRPGYTIRENTWGANASSHWWDGTQPQPMPNLEDAISKLVREDGVDFTGIPAGTRVETYGVGLRTVVTVDDGILEYDTDEPGTHYFRFDHPRYVRWADVTLEVE